jgi:hypothetical protein
VPGAVLGKLIGGAARGRLLPQVVSVLCYTRCGQEWRVPGCRPRGLIVGACWWRHTGTAGARCRPRQPNCRRGAALGRFAPTLSGQRWQVMGCRPRGVNCRRGLAVPLWDGYCRGCSGIPMHAERAGVAGARCRPGGLNCRRGWLGSRPEGVNCRFGLTAPPLSTLSGQAWQVLGAVLGALIVGAGW